MARDGDRWRTDCGASGFVVERARLRGVTTVVITAGSVAVTRARAPVVFAPAGVSSMAPPAA